MNNFTCKLDFRRHVLPFIPKKRLVDHGNRSRVTCWHFSLLKAQQWPFQRQCIPAHCWGEFAELLPSLTCASTTPPTSSITLNARSVLPIQPKSGFASPRLPYYYISLSIFPKHILVSAEYTLGVYRDLRLVVSLALSTTKMKKRSNKEITKSCPKIAPRCPPISYRLFKHSVQTLWSIDMNPRIRTPEMLKIKNWCSNDWKSEMLKLGPQKSMAGWATTSGRWVGSGQFPNLRTVNRTIRPDFVVLLTSWLQSLPSGIYNSQEARSWIWILSSAFDLSSNLITGWGQAWLSIWVWGRHFEFESRSGSEAEAEADSDSQLGIRRRERSFHPLRLIPKSFR